jgi:adenylate kinase family enzyme
VRIIGIVGPPAAGKTTLASALGRYGSIFRLRTAVPSTHLLDRDGRPKDWLDHDVVARAFIEFVSREYEKSTRLLLCDNFPGTVTQVDLIAEVRSSKAEATVVRLMVEQEVLKKRASSRRVCRNCERDPLDDPRCPAIESKIRPGTCVQCGQGLLRRPNDRQNSLIGRLDRFQHSINEIEQRCAAHAIKVIQVDSHGTPADTERAVRASLVC